MSFVTDIIKIKYIEEGYLPNNPYWLTSDEEMIEAFTKEDGYFNANYPCLSEELEDSYEELVDSINSALTESINTKKEIPVWILSFMNGSVVSINSDERDIAELYYLLNIDSEASHCVFDKKIQEQCYEVSKQWLKKTPALQNSRPASLFGEPHVVKSLRLSGTDILS